MRALGTVGAILGAGLLGLSAEVGAQSLDPVVHMEPGRVPGVSLPPGAPRGFAGPELFDPRALLQPQAAPLGRQSGRPNPPNVLVLLGRFSDTPAPHIPQAEVQRVLFDGPREGGTFVDFYREASRGLIDPGGEVAPWVQTDVTLLEGAGDLNGHGWVGERMQDYVIQTVEQADPFIDYRQYDNDGPDGIPDSGDDDGWVDALVIEYLEIPGSCGGPGPWPHFSGVSQAPGVPGWPTDDIGSNGQPIRVQAYLTQSVADCSGVNIQGPNVIAHEYGHLLGLPDLYQAIEGIEPEKRHWNVGCYDLMGAGSWGCGEGQKAENFGPVHMGAFMKSMLGWMPFQYLGPVREREYVLEPAQTTGRALGLEVGDGSFVQIEYRPRIGFDEWLPAGGVVVYHFDPFYRSRSVPDGLPPAKYLHLIEADGDHALRKVEAEGGNRGVAGDVFGLPGRTGPYSSAPGPVRLLDHEGNPMTITIHEVEVQGETARVVLSTAPEPDFTMVESGVGLVILEEGELAHFRIAGGAPPYQVEVDGDLARDVVVSLEGFGGSIQGTPTAAGTLDLALTIVDSRGSAVPRTVAITVADLDFAVEDVIRAIVGVLLPPDAQLEAYLDGQGNENGRADIGDLRGYLNRRSLLN